LITPLLRRKVAAEVAAAKRDGAMIIQVTVFPASNAKRPSGYKSGEGPSKQRT